MVVIPPLLLTPALLGLMGTMIGKQMRQAQVESYPVGIVGAGRAPSLARSLGSGSNT
jgi:hypothetical protein